MPESATIQLSIFDLNGRQIFNTTQEMGSGVQNLNANLGANGSQYASGLYIYRLTVGQATYNGKISVVTR